MTISRTFVASPQGLSIDRKTPTDIRALSIAGPFGRLIAEGNKLIEMRSWATSHQGLILLHVSASKNYDWLFSELSMSFGDCPKSSLIGAATLTGCIKYEDAKTWEEDYDRHGWNEEYHTVRYEYYEGKPPVGHIFSDPILFDKPIRGISGALNYWKPRTQAQQSAFEQAIAFLN